MKGFSSSFFFFRSSSEIGPETPLVQTRVICFKLYLKVLIPPETQTESIGMTKTHYRSSRHLTDDRKEKPRKS